MPQPMVYPIINSLLDTDLYKFTMMQCVLHQFPQAEVRYALQCRSKVNLSQYVDEINTEVDKLCQLYFDTAELEFLAKLGYFTTDFIEFLRLFRLQRKFIEIYINNSGQLAVDIQGPWLHTIMFEVPVLAIISEVYSRNNYVPLDLFEKEGEQRLWHKIKLLKDAREISNFRFTDFGTRRRYSLAWQTKIIEILKQELPIYFVGTSNVALAKKFQVQSIGTMAHEFIQAAQALGSSLLDSQKFALESWIKEYRGKLGIALTDTISMQAFLKDFDLYFGKIYDGLRIDSGDPIKSGDLAIHHYHKLGIDPKTKTLVFSDNLNIPKALELYHYFDQYIKVIFGIGTNLTNDLGHPAPQIVIKMIECNQQPVAKISDDPAKIICQDLEYVAYLKKIFGNG